MELKLQLSVFVLLIQVSLAVWQRKTVMKGQTLNLRCPITNAHINQVEWRNPDGNIMFFNKNKVLRDERYSIKNLSKSVFAITVSEVTFKDGGNYTCSQYGSQTTERIVEVTVLGHPKIRKTKHEGKIVVECTAEGNHFPPRISWKFDEGPEVYAENQVSKTNKKYTSTQKTEIIPTEKSITVKCIVRHPGLYSHTRMAFVKIGQDSKSSSNTTATSSPAVQGSTQVLGSTTSWLRQTADVNRPSSESATVPSTGWISSSDPKIATSPPLSPVTDTGPHLNTSDKSRSSVLPGSTGTSNDSISEEPSTTGRTYFSETTENITIDNITDSNITGNANTHMRKGDQGNSSLLVFLVTCLICCLLVVVIFFTIKLRRAHLAWKRENEDSNPSEESNKSKSSSEEKNSQAQRRRGLFNTAFTQYVVEEPTGTMTSVHNTAAIAARENGTNGQISQPQTVAQTSAKSDIKETSL